MFLINSFHFYRIVSDIYEGLYGCDHQILLLYYALLNQVAENEIIHHLKPKDHMKMIRRLKNFKSNYFNCKKCLWIFETIYFLILFPDIDYKLLTNEPPKLIEAVIPSVFNSGTSQVANLLFSLPEEIKQRANFEDVLEKITEKIFFNGVKFSLTIEYIRVFSSGAKYFHIFLIAGNFIVQWKIRIMLPVFRKNSRRSNE